MGDEGQQHEGPETPRQEGDAVAGGSPTTEETQVIEEGQVGNVGDVLGETQTEQPGQEPEPEPEPTPEPDPEPEPETDAPPNPTREQRSGEA